jgi:hypothetical protein
MKRFIIFCLVVIIFLILACKTNDHIQKVDQLEKEGNINKILLDSRVEINPPKWIQGIWLLNKSYSYEKTDWVDRSNEKIKLIFENDNIFFNWKSIISAVYYENVDKIFERTGYDFLHGKYYEIVYSTQNYEIMFNRYYYYSNDNFMRVEYYEHGLQKGIEYFKRVFEISEVITITDVLDVRTSPSIRSEIIHTINFGEVLHVYDEQGSGDFVFEDGTLDLWYKISQNLEEWVNAFYVRKFPFYIAGEGMVYGIDNGRNDMYTGLNIVNIRNVDKIGGIWLNMDVYNHKGGIGADYKKDTRIENVQESYFFNNETIRLKDNLFNNIIELYNDIKIKTEDLPPSVAWSGEEHDAKEYDLSEMKLKYGIETGKQINHIIEILGPFYFTEYANVVVYSQWGEDYYGFGQFKIKFFTRENNGEVFKIIYEIPLL